MHSNDESIPHLQNDLISDWVSVRLVSNSEYRDAILQALGQSVSFSFDCQQYTLVKIIHHRLQIYMYEADRIGEDQGLAQVQ